VGQTPAPLDGAKVWALSDQPVSKIAFNPFLSQNMSDEKGKASPRYSCALLPGGALHPRISESAAI
jgi:hypothetical protein